MLGFWTNASPTIFTPLSNIAGVGCRTVPEIIAKLVCAPTGVRYVGVEIDGRSTPARTSASMIGCSVAGVIDIMPPCVPMRSVNWAASAGALAVPVPDTVMPSVGLAPSGIRIVVGARPTDVGTGATWADAGDPAANNRSASMLKRGVKSRSIASRPLRHCAPETSPSFNG